MKNIRHLVLAAAFVLPSLSQAAGEFPAQARLFAGLTWANNEALNQEMRTGGLKEFGPLSKLGVEITFALTPFLDVGLSYAYRYIEQDELNSLSTTNYHSALSQNIGLAVVRLPFLKTDYLRADAFVGVGGANTMLSLETTTQNGEYSKKGASDFFASIVSSYGASVGVGYKNFFVYVEGGYESNKIDSLNRAGNLTGSINSLDMSGAYGILGLMFDGVTARKQ